MKNILIRTCTVLSLALLLTSCYTYSYTVGNGSQTGQVVESKNTYLIYGLVDLETSDPVDMADGAANYDVTIEHTFLDGLLAAITFGIYTPTTTIVRK